MPQVPSPGPSNAEVSSSPVGGSGFKRPRSDREDVKSVVTMEQQKEDRVHKSRHTMTGADSKSTSSKDDKGKDDVHRSKKHRQTVDFGDGEVRIRTANTASASDEPKRDEKKEDRKSIIRKASSKSSKDAEVKVDVETEKGVHADGRKRKSKAADRDSHHAAPHEADKPKAADKGKSRAVSTAPRSPGAQGASSSHVSKDKGKARATGPAPVPDYQDVSAAYKLHEQVPSELPEPKRLQKLVELALEEEQAQVDRLYGSGPHEWISRAFGEICNDFIIKMEQTTIARMKRLNAAGAARPAQTAYARGEEEPAQPNPLNDGRTAMELSLSRTLERFQQEEREWERLVAAAAAPPPPAAAMVPLPPAGTPLPSTHPLLQELSIADRNLIAYGGRDQAEELSELVAWAKGLVEGGLDRARSCLASVETRRERADAAHRRLVGSLRRRALGPLNVDDPKRILRSMAGPA